MEMTLVPPHKKETEANGTGEIRARFRGGKKRVASL